MIMFQGCLLLVSFVAYTLSPSKISQSSDPLENCKAYDVLQCGIKTLIDSHKKWSLNRPVLSVSGISDLLLMNRIKHRS